jgi:tRNA dimethylallyltransferase
MPRRSDYTVTPARKPAVLFIVGATASGKTDAAIAVAQALDAKGRAAEIVNADSRQVYRGMSIGTAKPRREQLAAVPHHLVNVADPADGFSLATFLSLARDAIADILHRDAVPVVVGGTGQYVWGLVEGWEAPAVPPQPELRETLEAEAKRLGTDALYARLRTLDPDAGALIDPRNLRRMVRALEVIEATGKPFSGQRRKTVPPFEPRLFGPSVPRTELHTRIAQRIDSMFEAGFVDEVRSLLERGYTPDLPAFSSAGYREIAAYLHGDIALDETKARTRVATNRLARSQANWFRAKDPRISWHAEPEALVDAAVDGVRRSG